MENKEDAGTAYVCDVCGKVIANKCNLKRHKLMHTGFNESVKCQICQKTLSSEGNLKRHMRMHTGNQERQECNACGKSFSNVGNLRRHLRTHQTPGVHYECKLCNKSFPFEDYLKKHVRTVHGIGEIKRKSESSTLPHIESFIKREEECLENEDKSEVATAAAAVNNQHISEPSESEEEKLCASNALIEPVTAVVTAAAAEAAAEAAVAAAAEAVVAETLVDPCKEEQAIIQEVKVEMLKESPVPQSTQESDVAPSDSLTSTEPQDVGECSGQDLRDKVCPTENCTLCKQVLTDPTHVNLDVWRMHVEMRLEKKSKSEKYSFDYNCSICGKFLSNKGNLKRHMLLLHKKDLSGCDVDTTIEQIRSECHLCGRLVANRGNLKRHIEKVHLKRLVGNALDAAVAAQENEKSELLTGTQIAVEQQSESEVKLEPSNSTEGEIEPPLKKRREELDRGASIIICSKEDCMEPKPTLKVRIKTTPQIPNTVPLPLQPKDEATICMDQTTICNDPTCPEYKKLAREAQEQANLMVPSIPADESGKEQPSSGMGDNSMDMKVSGRWRSRSFDESYASQPNVPIKNGVCSIQCGENHSCPTCKRRFLCEDNFKKHMKRHRSCKLPKPLDTRVTLEGINELAPNTLVCHLCGQVMPFPASLQHHLQVVHGIHGTCPTEVQNVLQPRCPDSQGSPTTAFSAPSTPVRKLVPESHPPDSTPEENHCAECAKEEKPVVVMI